MSNPKYKDPDTIHHLNMKAVVRETGIQPDTLRAWERRYGLPQPHRSEGGHRLYSDRDVQVLLWLKARQEEGLTIKLAVDQWRRLEESGSDPLRTLLEKDESGAASHSTMDVLRDRWVKACRDFDEGGSDQVLSNAFAMFSPAEVSIELLSRGLARIGSMWEHGTLTVQQEHFASEVARRKVEALITAAPAPVRAGKVLILCPPGEDHAFIPLLVTYLLRQNGRAVVFLGANVPVHKLEDSLRSVKPVLVILTASHALAAASMLDLLRVLRVEGVQSAYGGSVFSRFPELIPRIPAHYLGDDLSDVVNQVESLIIHQPPLPHFHPVDEELLIEGQKYLSRQVEIEQYVWKAIQLVDPAYDSVAAVNRFMSSQILAAINLGIDRPLYIDRDKFLSVLQVNGFADDYMESYLDAYLDAMQEYLGPDSSISREYQQLRG
jgi:MerR family transcriptional regulator, light-induced transcriptional regulator